MWMADRFGLGVIADRLAHYARERGNRFGYWSVSPLLARLAAEGRRISDWQPA